MMMMMMSVILMIGARRSYYCESYRYYDFHNYDCDNDENDADAKYDVYDGCDNVVDNVFTPFYCRNLKMVVVLVRKQFHHRLQH